ncbi:MAG TPA: hypothetical protein VL242_53725 [Sorangium sp.]|nr:hypothetical protein [Sorangium sp.]
MKLALSYTVYTGSEAQFPTVVAALRKHYPNSAGLLNMVAEVNAATLKQQARWQCHVLNQLTFSYLAQDYVATSVQPVLAGLPDSNILPSLVALRDMASRIETAEIRLTTQSVGALNNLAIKFLEELAQNRTALIVEAINNLGRYIFSNFSRSNSSRVQRHINLLGVAIDQHLSEEFLCRRFREELSFQGYDDRASLKKLAIQALERLRDDLQRSTTASCLFVCADIKMSSERFDVGAATFFPAGDPELRRRTSSCAEASSWLDQKIKEDSYAAYALVEARCHPDDRDTAIENAAGHLEEVLGFLVSQQATPRFSPPRRYEALGFLANTPGVTFYCPSARAQNSLLLVRPPDGTYFSQLYSKYIAPALAAPVEPMLQEKLRRMLRTLRRASFSAGCLEYSQAYASAWQAYEVVFGGVESRERGDSIARRVAALAIRPDALGADDAVELDDGDMIQLAKAHKSGDSKLQLEPATSALLNELADAQNPTEQELLWVRMSFGSEELEEVLAWKERQIAAAASSRSEDESTMLAVQKRDQLRWRLQECYKLRNDMVHAGYDEESVAETMYLEIFSLYSSFVTNLAFNCTKKVTYDALLDAIDKEWRRGRTTEPSTSDEAAIRLAAFDAWEKRGRPMWDDWADWFSARKALGLE